MTFLLSWRSDDQSTEAWHLDGVAWRDVPIPRRFHRCRVQTRSWSNYFTQVERCGCGALRVNGRRWITKNQRLRSYR